MHASTIKVLFRDSNGSERTIYQGADGDTARGHYGDVRAALTASEDLYLMVGAEVLASCHTDTRGALI